MESAILLRAIEQLKPEGTRSLSGEMGRFVYVGPRQSMTAGNADELHLIPPSQLAAAAWRIDRGKDPRMGLMDAPKGMRLHIGIFGRRNVGKSSLLNAITRQEVSIVSDFAGTTTDPVEKPMELLPLGPVLFIDTAGIDDVGALGELRARRTMQVFDRPKLPFWSSGLWAKQLSRCVLAQSGFQVLQLSQG